jgi:hypothetical protein
VAGMLYEKIKYSKISLMQLAEDWRNARLSHILDYQAVSILAYFIQVNMCYTSYAWGYRTNHRSISFGYILQLLV